MPVQPMGGYGNGFGFGGDWSSWIILFLIFGMFGMGGFGGFGGGMGFDFPWLLNGQNGINANTNAGFQNLATQNQISSLQNSVTTGFSNAEVAACNRAMADQALSFNNQIADLNRSFDAQTAIMQGQNAIQSQLSKCCCDNQLQTESLRATVLQENCEDRNQALLNTRDLLTAGTTNTQTILDAVRSINDKLCDQELQAERRENDNLRTQLNMQNLAASQAAQTAAIIADNTAQTGTLIQRIAPYPVPAYPVGNPYSYWNGGCGNFGGFNGNF